MLQSLRNHRWGAAAVSLAVTSALLALTALPWIWVVPAVAALPLLTLEIAFDAASDEARAARRAESHGPWQ